MIDPIALFTIAGAIASIISGFKDGKDMFRAWWAKRKLKNASRVYNSLDTNSQAIQQGYNHGRSRFGAPFKVGDDIARNSMTQVLIRMNEQLIGLLRMILQPASQLLDSESCRVCSAADGVRQDVSDIFTHFGQRLLVSAPLRRAFSANARPQAVQMNATGTEPYNPSDYLPPSTWAPEPEPRQPTNRPNHHSVDNDRLNFDTEAYTLSEPYVKKTKWSFRRHSQPGSSTTRLERELADLRGQSVNIELPNPTISKFRVDALEKRLTVNHGTNYDISTPLPSPASESDLVLAKNLEDLKKTPRSGKLFRSEESRASISVDTSTIDPTTLAATSPRYQIDEWVEHNQPSARADDPLPTNGDSTKAVFELPAIPIRQPTRAATWSFTDQSRRQRQPEPQDTYKSAVQAEDLRGVHPTQPLHHAVAPAEFCPAALYLQRNSQASVESSRYTLARYGDAKCNSCGVQIPRQGFSVGLSTSTGLSQWHVGVRFMAKCHTKGKANGVAQMRCILCAPPGRLFRGRNELWRHLEEHSVAELEAEVDIDEG